MSIVFLVIIRSQRMLKFKKSTVSTFSESGGVVVFVCGRKINSLAVDFWVQM